MAEKLLSNPRSSGFSVVSSSRKFSILSLMLRSVMHSGSASGEVAFPLLCLAEQLWQHHLLTARFSMVWPFIFCRWSVVYIYTGLFLGHCLTFSEPLTSFSKDNDTLGFTGNRKVPVFSCLLNMCYHVFAMWNGIMFWFWYVACMWKAEIIVECLPPLFPLSLWHRATH